MDVESNQTRAEPIPNPEDLVPFQKFVKKNIQPSAVGARTYQRERPWCQKMHKRGLRAPVACAAGGSDTTRSENTQKRESTEDGEMQIRREREKGYDPCASRLLSQSTTLRKLTPTEGRPSCTLLFVTSDLRSCPYHLATRRPVQRSRHRRPRDATVPVPQRPARRRDAHWTGIIIRWPMVGRRHPVAEGFLKLGFVLTSGRSRTLSAQNLLFPEMLKSARASAGRQIRNPRRKESIIHLGGSWFRIWFVRRSSWQVSATRYPAPPAMSCQP